jgi:hypothetical protein
VFYAYLSDVKQIEIGFTQNNLSIRVGSVRLEFLLPPKTNYFPYRFISLKCGTPFLAILAYGGMTIANFLCSVPISQPKDVAMLHTSLRMMMPPLMLCTNVCKEAALIS